MQDASSSNISAILAAAANSSNVIWSSGTGLLSVPTLRPKSALCEPARASIRSSSDANSSEMAKPSTNGIHTSHVDWLDASHSTLFPVPIFTYRQHSVNPAAKTTGRNR